MFTQQTLSQGSIQALIHNKPIHAKLQVLDIKKVTTTTGSRYRCVFSDGQYYIQGMLAAKNEYLVVNHNLNKFCIINVTECVSLNVNPTHCQDKTILIVISCNVISNPGAGIGQPINIQYTLAAEKQHENKHVETKFISFDNSDNIKHRLATKWAINAEEISESEKDIIAKLKKSIESIEWTMVERCVSSLLKSNPNYIPFMFLAAICYDACSYVSRNLSEPDQIKSFGETFSISSQRFSQLTEYYYQTILELQPNNVLYILQYTFYLSFSGHVCIRILCNWYNRLHTLLKNKSYQYNIAKYVSINVIERDFLSQYILNVLREEYYTRNSTLYILDELCDSYKQLLHRLLESDEENEVDPHMYRLACTYVKAYSWFGKYKKSLICLKEYYSQYDYFDSGQYMSIFIEVADYEDLKHNIWWVTSSFSHWINQRPGQSQPYFNNCLLHHGYLCLLHSKTSETITQKKINKLYKQCQMLIKQHRHFSCNKRKYKYAVDQSCLNFMQICFVILCHAKGNVGNINSCQTFLRSIKGSLFQNKYTDTLQHEYNVYLVGLIADTVYAQCINQQPIDLFFYALLSTIDQLEKYSNMDCFMHPFIPLAYYHIGLHALDGALYQTAWIFLKKSVKLTNDLVLINSNCLKLIQKCETKWTDMKCGYCGIMYSKLGTKLKCCKGCCRMFYCSKRCQKWSWKYHHRYKCSKIWVDRLTVLDCLWW
eukprot:445395_1